MIMFEVRNMDGVYSQHATIEGARAIAAEWMERGLAGITIEEVIRFRRSLIYDHDEFA